MYEFLNNLSTKMMFILFRKPPVPSVWRTSQQGDDVLHHDQEGQRRHLWRTDRRERAHPVGPGPAQLLPSCIPV